MASHNGQVLAIIPARGGSKGLPGKNIKPLAGHPLIAYSILAAQRCQAVGRIMVNTDNEEIAGVAREYGAEVAFMRPAELAKDDSTDLEVFQHHLAWLKENEDYQPELVMQLRPTSPIRFTEQLDRAVHLMREQKEADSVRVVTKAPNTPYKMWIVDKEGQPMKPLLQLPEVDEPYNMPRQKLPDVYWQIGALDVIRPSVITEHNSMSGKTILPIIQENRYAIDIDDIFNFKRAEETLKESDCIKFEEA